MAAPSNKPFLAVICRPAPDIIASELDRISTFGDLSGSELEAVLMVSEPVPQLSEVNLDNYSGVFLSGSEYTFGDPPGKRHPGQDELEDQLLEFSERLIAQDFPTLGICYGMHALNLAAGGSLTGAFGEDIGAPVISLTEAGLTDELTGQLPRNFQSFLGHHDSVGTPPAGSAVLAYSELCPIQMLRIGNNLYGTQFHPEIDNEGMKIRNDYYAGDYFDLEKAETIEKERAAADVDGANYLITAFTQRYRRRY